VLVVSCGPGKPGVSSSALIVALLLLFAGAFFSDIGPNSGASEELRLVVKSRQDEAELLWRASSESLLGIWFST
jgi:hypothetical protein